MSPYRSITHTFQVFCSCTTILLATACSLPFTAFYDYAYSVSTLHQSFRRAADAFKDLVYSVVDAIQAPFNGIHFSQLIHDAYAVVCRRLQVRASAPVRFATMGVHFA